VAIEEKFPTMSDADLASLQANVERLLTTGAAPQMREAERLTPLIVAEIAARRANAPAPKSGARKKKLVKT
jgi:hypothetical protein